ncbi:hypothetical protein [Endozoicomonas sp.]|uniref:hypothetical protein n=1 Tax=Endozoicomonas sp. TaxID=1892382 RepID=UPI00383A8864
MINWHDIHGLTALKEAARNGALPCIKPLVAMGASPWQEKITTSLHEALFKDKTYQGVTRYDVLKELLEAIQTSIPLSIDKAVNLKPVPFPNKTIKEIDKNSRRILESENTVLNELLSRKEIPFDETDQIARLLLRFGANPLIKNANDETAFSLWFRHQNLEAELFEAMIKAVPLKDLGLILQKPCKIPEDCRDVVWQLIQQKIQEAERQSPVLYFSDSKRSTSPDNIGLSGNMFDDTGLIFQEPCKIPMESKGKIQPLIQRKIQASAPDTYPSTDASQETCPYPPISSAMEQSTSSLNSQSINELLETLNELQNAQETSNSGTLQSDPVAMIMQPVTDINTTIATKLTQLPYRPEQSPETNGNVNKGEAFNSFGSDMINLVTDNMINFVTDNMMEKEQKPVSGRQDISGSQYQVYLDFQKELEATTESTDQPALANADKEKRAGSRLMIASIFWQELSPPTGVDSLTSRPDATDLSPMINHGSNVRPKHFQPYDVDVQAKKRRIEKPE